MERPSGSVESIGFLHNLRSCSVFVIRPPLVLIVYGNEAVYICHDHGVNCQAQSSHHSCGETPHVGAKRVVAPGLQSSRVKSEGPNLHQS